VQKVGGRGTDRHGPHMADARFRRNRGAA
jgi:hypothetical protein